MTTTNPTEVEARARAHAILRGGAASVCGGGMHGATCETLTAALVADATALETVTRERDEARALADARGVKLRTMTNGYDRERSYGDTARAEAAALRAEVARLQEAVAGARAGAFREAATMVSDMQDNWRTVSDAPQVPSEKIGYGDVGGSFPARGQSACEAESTARAALRMAATKLSRLATPPPTSSVTAPEPTKETP